MRRLSPILLAASLLLPACGETPEPEPTPAQCEPAGTNLEAGDFVAGAASARIPAPLGIGTAGFGPFGLSNPSPYADRFPATDRIHGHPTLKAVVLSRGEGHELVFLLADMVAVPQQLRDAIATELEQRVGRSFEHSLIMGATHTHSGPGRFIDGGLFHLAVDYFLPDYYERLVTTSADVVEAAMTEAGPAELGWTIPQAPDAHNDRRCVDGEYRNDAMPVIVVKRDGEVRAVVTSYAMHGTIGGIDEFTLSQDAHGAAEEKIAQRFDHPVEVLLFNSWAADMSPGNPSVTDPATLTTQPDGYDQMERIGQYLADIVEDAVDAAPLTSEPTLAAWNTRYPINREAIGYDWDTFKYEWGGVYCEGEEDCDNPQPIENLDEVCLPMPETSPAPMQTMVTVGRIDGLHFTTWSGECGTHLAEKLTDQMAQADGVEATLFFGYANDYLGYALEEENWWLGGYEASGAMWGPRQGDYMAESSAEAFSQWKQGCQVGWDQPEQLPAFDMTGLGSVQPEQSMEFGQVLAQPQASYAADGVATFTVNGDDPWVGTPRAVLQRESGGAWVDVAKVNGDVLNSDSYGFWVDLTETPSYEDTLDPTTRAFHWAFSAPLARRDTGLTEPLAGSTLRFAVTLPQADADPMVVTSEPFTVAP